MSRLQVPETPVFSRQRYSHFCLNTFELVLTCRKIPRSEVKSLCFGAPSEEVVITVSIGCVLVI